MFIIKPEMGSFPRERGKRAMLVTGSEKVFNISDACILLFHNVRKINSVMI